MLVATGYSFIAFTSRNGIDAFFNRAKALGLVRSLPLPMLPCGYLAVRKGVNIDRPPSTYGQDIVAPGAVNVLAGTHQSGSPVP